MYLHTGKKLGQEYINFQKIKNIFKTSYMYKGILLITIFIYLELYQTKSLQFLM